MVYIEESGPECQCNSEPKDTDTKEDREQYEAGGGEGHVDPQPDPAFFGEACDCHCVKPPWEGTDDCNSLRNCRIFQIADPNDNIFIAVFTVRLLITKSLNISFFTL
mgnify:CR=1 FL=1